MIQPSLYEERFKVEGMERAAGKNRDILNQARAAAISLGLKPKVSPCRTEFGIVDYIQTDSEVTIDDVRAELERRGIEYKSGNWMGSVFKDGNWSHIGYRPSNHKGGHARVISVWRFTGGGR